MSRTHYTDKEKARIIQEYEKHGGSAAAFCRQHGVSYKAFLNWQRRPSSTSLSIKAEPPAAFLEFELGSAPSQRVSTGPLVELELGGGIILRIHPAHTAQL